MFPALYRRDFSWVSCRRGRFIDRPKLGVIAGQALKQAAGETIITASGGDVDHAIGGSLRIHSGQAVSVLTSIQTGADSPGLSAIAAQGPLRVEAQHGAMNIDARQDLKLVSVSQSLEAAAKTRITLTTKAGATISIDGGNVSIHCPGQLVVHAAKHAFEGPTQMQYPLPVFKPDEFCLSCFIRAAKAGGALVPT